jgi:myo-inositol-1(or 4)-monophosphatase
MLWDVAAGIAIVEGAGGRVKKIQGSSTDSFNVIADNGRINLNTIGR